MKTVTSKSITSCLTLAAVEYTDASVAPVVDLVVTQHRIAVGLNPDARHRVVEDLVVGDDALPAVVHEDAPVLAAPDLVPFDQRVAPRPATQSLYNISIEGGQLGKTPVGDTSSND